LPQIPPAAVIISDPAELQPFRVVIEQKVVLSNFTSISEAAMYCFACHYVFNMEYQAIFTYDFLQRYVTRIGLLDRKIRPRVKNLALQLNL